MRKNFLFALFVLLMPLYIKAQVVSFNVSASTGVNYIVMVDVGSKNISAVTTDNFTEFSYKYSSYDVGSNLIGFSFKEGASVLMRPDHEKQYFLVRNDAIFCSTADASKEFYLVPTVAQAYNSEFSRLRELLGKSSAPTRTEEPVKPKPNSENVTTFTVKGVSFNMVYVQGGTFQMGSNTGDIDEKPIHNVTLSPYKIGQTEVTQELWEAVMGSNPSKFVGLKRPVENVSWKDCQTFISELNRLTGQSFRLPTEAEWEYAARGGVNDGTQYSGSDAIATVAWYGTNSGGETHDVATKVPNRLGIYDMSGNVWEWCQDRYGSRYYKKSPNNNPTGPSSGFDRVNRGGSWNNLATFCRSACRYFNTPSFTFDDLGMRLAL